MRQERWRRLVISQLFFLQAYQAPKRTNRCGLRPPDRFRCDGQWTARWTERFRHTSNIAGVGAIKLQNASERLNQTETRI